VPKKAFLSHSSKDKGVVEKIFKQLGAAKVHYDSATFEQGESSAAAIFAAIQQTDVFVLFVSEISVTSRWVTSELHLAQHFLISGSMSKVLVFILDDTPTDALPEWLRIFVNRRSSSPGIIASAIRSTLFELALAANPSLDFFVGRSKELTSTKDALSSLNEASPAVLFVGGNEGIGRRTLARHALADVHPQLIRMPIEVTLEDEQGAVEFYRALVDQAKRPSLLESVDLLEAFAALSPPEQADALATLVEEIAEQRQIVVVRGKDAILADDGAISEWLSDLIKKIHATPWPKMVVISRRMITPHRRVFYPNVFFVQVNSLDEADSKRLLSIWLKHLGISIASALVDDICQHVTGHPRNIQIAARYAAEFGVARIDMQRTEFLETVRQQSTIIIDGLKLDVGRERLLALFAEYEYLSHEDLLVATGAEDTVALEASIGYLLDHGILESDGPYVRLAPYLPIMLSRYAWKTDAKRFVDECRGRILQQTSTLSTMDEVKISTIDSSILSALHRGKELDNPLLVRCLLPSHLLRVARVFYDRREYSRTIELSKRAYEGRGKLTVDAQIEALRLWCLSAVRVGNASELDAGMAFLAQRSGHLPSRNLHFIRGFKARYDGRLEQAEAEFRQAYTMKGEHNFHILRELSQLSRLKEDLVEAESFARAAFKIADKNPYVIDSLLEILIERHRGDRKYLEQNPELQRLFDVLEETAHFANRSFYESRRAHLFGVLKDTPHALEWAREAATKTPHHVPVLLTLARIELDASQTTEARATLTKAIKQINSAGSNLDRRHVGDVDKLMVVLEIQSGDFAAARKALNRASSLPRTLRESLLKKIDTAEAYAKR